MKGVPTTSPATEYADAVLEYLEPLVDLANEGLNWHTKRRMRVYMDGYQDAVLAVREAFVRATEDVHFREAIEAGEIPKFRMVAGEIRANPRTKRNGREKAPRLAQDRRGPESGIRLPLGG